MNIPARWAYNDPRLAESKILGQKGTKTTKGAADTAGRNVDISKASAEARNANVAEENVTNKTK